VVVLGVGYPPAAFIVIAGYLPVGGGPALQGGGGLDGLPDIYASGAVVVTPDVGHGEYGFHIS